MKTVSLFSGAGGMDLGFESAGFESLFCSDIDAFSCQTLAQNHRSVSSTAFLQHTIVEKKDIWDLNPSDVLDQIGLQKGELDLMIGGPPCQSFSVFGKRGGLRDPRGTLLWQYLRILDGVNPKAFVFENVPGLLTIDSGTVFIDFISRAEQLGFHIDAYLLEAADFGVPQFRKRIFVIGNRFGKRLPAINATHFSPSSKEVENGGLPWRTAEDGLRGLPIIGECANHTGRRHSDRIVHRYLSLLPGERDHFTRINKLDLKRPSYTIIVGSDKGGGKGHVHPTQPREVTPRESARMQTFPDHWTFAGQGRHVIRQVGNAVPPLLAANVANFLRSELFGEESLAPGTLVKALEQTHLYECTEELLRSTYCVGIPSILIRQPSVQKTLPLESTQAMLSPLSSCR